MFYRTTNISFSATIEIVKGILLNAHEILFEMLTHLSNMCMMRLSFFIVWFCLTFSWLCVTLLAVVEVRIDQMSFRVHGGMTESCGNNL